MSIRVLHVGKFYPPHMGGMESHLAALCAELKRFIEVKVLVAGLAHSTEILEDIPVTRLRTVATIASTPFCRRMTAEIRDSKADLVHIHWPNPAAVLAYLQSGHRGPLVVTYHSDSVRQKFLGALFEPILHRFLDKSAAILVTSPQYLESSTVLRRHRCRCHVVPLGIRMPERTPLDHPEVKNLRQRYGSRILLTVGRLVYYKGFNHLIEAMSKVDGRLLIMGDGPLRADLERLAADRGVREKVVFLGNVPESEPYYQACDVFVLPSIARSEAFGIVQLEAMVAGKPVVNTNLDSGVPFVSLHNVTGLTVPPADAAALAAAITKLLDDPALRSSQGEAARERARTLFGVETMASRTLEIYRDVTGSQLPQVARHVLAS